MSPESVPLGVAQWKLISASPDTLKAHQDQTGLLYVLPYSPKAQHDEGFPLPHIKLIKGSKPVLASITQSGSVSLGHIYYVLCAGDQHHRMAKNTCIISLKQPLICMSDVRGKHYRSSRATAGFTKALRLASGGNFIILSRGPFIWWEH